MKELVKVWLESAGAKAVVAVSVTIGGETWEGARYHEKGNDRFYLVGMLPKGWGDTESGKVYYTLYDLVYCVTAYLQDFDSLTASTKQYHPFGNNWIMYLWEHDDAPDAHHGMVCRRQEMTVT